ncbi:MAG: glycogen synthase [Lachnospiraceae bacterium]|nr:glycogen synthase [Lachnospiraceae bacterium]
MKILFAASECLPFVKTGGLADVVGALPQYLDRGKFDARVIIPCYTMIPERFRSRMETLTHFYTFFNGRDRYVGVKTLEQDGIRCYFIDNEEYFGGFSPYTNHRYDLEKFAFFSKCVLSVLPSLGFCPDVIHCNDWHTGLIPMYLKTEFTTSDFYKNMRTVMTIHNLKFQGTYNAQELSFITGLSAELFTAHPERGEDGNYLRSGLVYADYVNTVSETYAAEILGPELGEGLDGVLRAKNRYFCGILNGIDDKFFDPETDAELAVNFNADDFRKLKKKNKTALQKELGLTVDEKAMMIGIVSRLTEQKGFDLVTEALPRLLELPIQLVVLGTGEERFERAFQDAAKAHPDRVSTVCTYSEPLSHRIYAASDAFLMPSRFEPCGLSQLIALRYGSLPIVRETGGLKDTVEAYNRYTGEGTGFTFWHYSPDVLTDIVSMAADTFVNHRRAWNVLAERAMRRDFSWKASARRYEELYEGLF